MNDLNRCSELEVLASSLDALVKFADRERDFALAAALEHTRFQFVERFKQAGS
jgi:hypothetical protein